VPSIRKQNFAERAQRRVADIVSWQERAQAKVCCGGISCPAAPFPSDFLLSLAVLHPSGSEIDSNQIFSIVLFCYFSARPTAELAQQDLVC
jgi:hypothetical protein